MFTGSSPSHSRRELPLPSQTGIDPQISAELVRAVRADGWTLTLHDRDGGDPVVLERGGRAAGEPALAEALTVHAGLLAEAGVADSFDGMPAGPHPAGTGIVGAAFGNARKTGAIVFAASVGNRPSDGAYLKTALRGTRRTVDAYFRLWQTSIVRDHRSDAFEAVLNAMDLGVILIDREGRLGFVNQTAERILAGGAVLRRRGSTLAAASLSGTMQLQAALALAIAMNAEDGNVRTLPEQSALLKLGAGEERLIIAALPAKLAASRSDDVAAMVLVLNPGGEPEKLVAPACKLYGLSAVETRLACQLVAGRSLQEACATMRIKEQTGRSYLKQVFAKTEVNRQVDLVRLLLTTLIRTRSNGIA